MGSIAPWAMRQRDPIRPQFTDHCFTGDYPTALTDQEARDVAATAAVAARGSELISSTCRFELGILASAMVRPLTLSGRPYDQTTR